MKAKQLLYKVAAVSFVLLSVWFLLTSNDVPNKMKAKADRTPFKKEQRIYRLVNAAEIRSAFALSSDKKIFLNIYPVKFSKDPQKNDFDLEVLFQDGMKDGKNLGTAINTKKFMQSSTWYLNYLKNNQVAKESVAHGYYIVVDEKSIQHLIGIGIEVTPKLSQMKYSLFYEKENEDEDDKKDDCSLYTMKVPPLLYDSGKCPPCLTTILLEDMVGKLITKEYKK